jgi:TRAP-type C4-dicarboxylate transport system permease small subunit
MSDLDARTEPARKGRLFASIATALAILGGCLSLGAAVLVTFSVASRWLGSGGVPGDFELVQIATALSVFCFLPHTQWRRGNIMVDTFTLRLPASVNRAIDAAWDFLLAGIMGLLTYCLLLGTEEAFSSGLTSMVIGLSIAPVFAICTVLIAILSITAVITGLALLRNRS